MKKYCLSPNVFKLLLLLFFWMPLGLQAQILNEKERAERYDALLNERIHNLLPELMDRHGIDMWVLISREYNEDPILRTMLPATWLNARRRTIILYYRDAQKNIFEALAVARYGIGQTIKSAWDKEQQPDQWARLVELIQERNPNKIGLNISEDYGIADGLVQTDYQEFMGHLPEELTSRIVSAEPLAVSWVETRTDTEMKEFEALVQVTHDIIVKGDYPRKNNK